MVTELGAIMYDLDTCLLSKISRASCSEHLRRLLIELGEHYASNQIYCMLIDKRRCHPLLEIDINWTQEQKKQVLNDVIGNIEESQMDDDSFELRSHSQNLNAFSYGLSLFYSRTACVLILPRSSHFPDGPSTSIRTFLPYCFHALNNILYLQYERPGVPLSKREIEVLEWMFHGKTNKEIGIILNISHYTIKNHIAKIFEKLEVANRTQAIEKAIRLNYLDLDYLRVNDPPHSMPHFGVPL